MSNETLAWLNRNVLIGFTDRRSTAWHYRSSEQGAEPNHYPGPIPVSEVTRRLFHWHAESHPVLVHAGSFGLRRVPNRQAITTSDTGDVLGIHMDGYGIHQFQNWLVDKVESILDNGLHVGSAGLLKNRAQAWVSVEMPDTITTPEGVPFRPNLTACTSHDGSLATTYKRMVTNIVCDNTMRAGLDENGQVIKIRHSRYAELKVLQARDALAMVMAVADNFADEVRQLSRIEVSDRTFGEFLRAYAPDRGTTRGKANVARVRSDLRALWTSDSRVEPWKNTAWGVVQAVNTYAHHKAPVRGTSRAERNLTRAVSDQAGAVDIGTLGTLDKVLSAA